MSATFDYNLASSQAPMGRYQASQGWAPGSGFDPSKSGQGKDRLGATSIAARSEENQRTIEGAFGQFDTAMNNLGTMFGTGMQGFSNSATTGLNQQGSQGREALANGLQMGNSAMTNQVNQQTNQANADAAYAQLKSQEKAAAQQRQGNMLGGLLGTAVDVGSMFLPGGKQIANLTGKLTGMG